MVAIFLLPGVDRRELIRSRIRGMITSDVDILEVASQWNVSPSTLRKILAGKPISRFTEKKIGSILERGDYTSGSRRQHNVETLLKIFRLYQAKGTLKAVGDEIGLSRERVRQLLVTGSESGLFKYKPFRKRFCDIRISRKKIMEDYGRLLSWKAVAQTNNVSLFLLRRFLDLYPISERDLEKRIARQKS